MGPKLPWMFEELPLFNELYSTSLFLEILEMLKGTSSTLK
jgi:hypothetical protein